jgi:hypothetical protein
MMLMGYAGRSTNVGSFVSPSVPVGTCEINFVVGNGISLHGVFPPRTTSLFVAARSTVNTRFAMVTQNE